MKPLIVILSLVLAALSLPASAQKPDKQARKASKSAGTRTAPSASARDRSQLTALAQAVRALTLTDSQQRKLEGITLKLEADLLATLTPDQQAQFKAALEDAKKNGTVTDEKPGKGRDPLASLRESLQLTPDQQAKVNPLLDQTRDKLTDLQKSARENRSNPDARKEAAGKSRELVDDLRAKLRPLLTPEQQTRLDAWQPKGKK